MKKAAYIPTNPTVLVNNQTSSVFNSPARSSKRPRLDSPLPIDPSLEPISPHDHSNIPKPSRFVTPALPSGSHNGLQRPTSETMSRPRFGDISQRDGSVAPSSRASSAVPQSRAPSVVPSALIKGSGRFGTPLGISSTHSRPSKAAPGGSSLPEFHSPHLPVPTNPQARIPKALTDKIVAMEADIKKLTDEVRQAHAAIALGQTKNQKLTDDLEAMQEKFSDAWAKQERELDEAINMMRDRFQIKGEQDLPVLVNSELNVRDNTFNVSLTLMP